VRRCGALASKSLDSPHGRGVSSVLNPTLYACIHLLGEPCDADTGVQPQWRPRLLTNRRSSRPTCCRRPVVRPPVITRQLPGWSRCRPHVCPPDVRPRCTIRLSHQVSLRHGGQLARALRHLPRWCPCRRRPVVGPPVVARQLPGWSRRLPPGVRPRCTIRLPLGLSRRGWDLPLKQPDACGILT